MNKPMRIIRLVVALLSMVPGLAFAETSRVWNYHALLDGKPIGTHRFAVTGDGPKLRLESDASFQVKILFVEVYRYQHKAREEWRGHCLARINSETRENGDKYKVDGSIRDGLFQLTTLKSGKTLAGCIMGFAYWNPRILKQTRLLNAQTGEYLPVRVESLGAETLQVRGIETRANRYSLHADKMKIDVWYKDDKEWVALESVAAGGRILRYELSQERN
jgi:Family of unknown function (DUF6134)